MQFIYLGEATFYEERMDEFLAVAKSLEIKGLSNAETNTNDELVDELSSCDQLTLSENLKEKTITSGQMRMQAPQDRQGRVVSVNGRHECDQCDKTYSGSGALHLHKQSAHQGVKYACGQCDLQVTQQGTLKRHIQSKHEGQSVKYVCNQCDHQFTEQGSLSRHVQSKHEGVRYACVQCDYNATYTTQGDLTRHIQKVHEGVRFACNQCDYQATTQGCLKRHNLSKHTGIKYELMKS